MKFKYLIYLMPILLFFTVCAKQVKPAPVSEAKTETKVLSDKEPTAEEESKIKLKINFDGKWRKKSAGSKAMIIITGKTGRIIGNNGAEIPIAVKYIDEMTVKIFEYEYNSKYLENWLPPSIASKIYLNAFLRKTYSILTIINEDTLQGMSYTWQVSYDKDIIQSIDPLVISEEWNRIKDE